MRRLVLAMFVALALAGCPITTVCRTGRVFDDAGACACARGTLPDDGGMCVPADAGP